MCAFVLCVSGWRYLFHPDERLPPFAVVVALPLDDVTPEMGPTEMCPGKKRRFYYGWRCDNNALPRLGSTAGTLVIFDYKTLHRGLGNAHPFKERPMVSMVFSRHFFINAEAFVNRGISLAATSILGGTGSSGSGTLKVEKTNMRCDPSSSTPCRCPVRV